ncbi:hypothetical protein SEPCBS119000_003203 [Sporothrix epigloea]|uniref:Pal1 cell morphology protein n=1 Tax=Sporothrix epigloea TaxID=1892477 RepID=A0ABP0DKC2_9PEZI
MSSPSPALEASKPRLPTGQVTRRSGHRSSRSNRPYTDTIDSLDRVGGVYHHEGPYDATLAAVNKNKKNSPLEAVKDSNLEAIKATPPEFIQDSLVKHVPLQGTSNIPSGMPDRFGNVLHYEEGADLMREADAPGGAYRRYDFITYHPDDLKGKGEPSYTIEKALKEHEVTHKLRKHSASVGHSRDAYEMRPTRGSGRGDYAAVPLVSGANSDQSSVRRRSMSHASGAASGLGQVEFRHLASSNDEGDLTRSSSTSNRLAGGIKRRFGSLRQKP